MKKHKLTIIAYFTGFYILSGCTESTYEEYIALANEYKSQGETSKAIIELKNAIKVSSDVAGARALLGEIYLERGQFLLAEKELEKALELGADTKAIVVGLIKARYYTQSYLDVIKLAESNNQAYMDEEAAMLFKYLSELKLGDVDETMPLGLTGDYKLIAEASELYANDRLELVWQKLQQFSNETIEPIEKALLIGEAAFRLARYQEAVNAFTIVESLAPNLTLPKLQLAESLIRNESLELAKEKVDQLLSRFGRSPYVHYLKSSLLIKSKDYPKALEYAEKSMQLGMDEFTALHVIAGISAYQIGNLEQAYFYLNKAEPNLVAESVARRVLAQTQLKLGYIDEVADEVGKWNVDNQEDSIILGSVIGSMLQQGDLAGATSLSIGINQNGDSSAIEQLREGMLRIASKDNSGLVNIENALQKDPSLEKAWVLLAQAQVKDGNISEALNVAKEWQNQEPDDGQVLEALIYSQNQEYDRAFGLLDEVLDRSPSNLGANQLSMNLLSTKQSYKKLLVRARAFLDLYPQNKGTLFMLANLGKVSEINQELESILLSQLNSSNSSEASITALARFYLVSENVQKAFEVYEKNQKKLGVSGYVIWGDSLLRTGNLSQAKEVYYKATKLFPERELPWIRTIGINEVEGNNEEAYTLALKAYDQFPQSNSLQLILLNYATRKGRIEEADKLVEELEQSQVSSSILLKYKGELALAKGDAEAAKRSLERYYSREPSFESAVLLSKALQLNGDASMGAKLMEKELERLPNKVKARHVLAEYYMFTKNFEAAEQKYINALKENKTDFVAANNLADLFIQTKKYSKALVYAKKAYAESPELGPVIETYGTALFKNGKTSQSISILSKGLELTPSDTQISLRLIEVLIADSQIDDARFILESIELDGISEADKARFGALAKALQ